MKELIEFIAKKLTSHPEDVSVRVIDRDEGYAYELQVHPEDMGKIIGRNGRTAKAIRSVLNSAASKAEVRVSLHIGE